MDVMQKGPNSVIRPIKDRIRAECKKRRLRLLDFFKSFDRTNTKRCTPSQFRRAMTQSTVVLSAEDLQLLVQRYSRPDPNASAISSTYVDYGKFCTQIDKVFTIVGLEKDPTKAVRLSLQDSLPAQMGVRFPSLTPLERETLRRVLQDFGRHCATRGYDVTILFGDFDRNNDGQISTDQFLRNVFVLCPELPMKEANLVAKAFGDKYGVNYRELARQCGGDFTQQGGDVFDDASLGVGDSVVVGGGGGGGGGAQASASPPSRPAPTSSSTFAFSNSVDDASLFAGGREPESAGETLKHFAMKFAQTPGIRIADYFVPFDKKRSGTISEAEFIKGVVRCFGSLTARQTKALTGAFSNGKSVDWRSFIDEVQRLAADLKYDREPGLVRASDLSPEEEDYVSATLDEICSKVVTNRILLKPTFQDFDRRNEDHVSREQFMRALSMFHLLPHSGAALELLFRAFCPTSHKHKAGSYVNYRKFLDYVDAVVARRERGQLARSAEAYEGVPRHLRSDFTPTMQPEPAATQWNRGTARIDNSPFATDDNNFVGLGGDGAGNLMQDSLSEFAKSYDFGAASVGGGEQMSSSFSVASSPGKSSVFLGRADKPFSALLADIRRTILKNRIRIRTFFEDQDKLRKGVITRSQFHRGLTSSGNKLSDSELATLCERFASSTGVDGHSNPLVRWVDFATDIDSVFTISGLDTNPEVDVVETLRRIRGVGYEPEQLPQINDDDNEKLAVFLGDFATEVAKKNVDLFPPFEDFDRFHRGTVTSNMFARVLSSYGSYPGNRIFDLLVEKFKNASVDSQKDVNYKAFIAVLEMIGVHGMDPRSTPSAVEWRSGLVADTTVPFDPSQFVEKHAKAPAEQALSSDVRETLEEVKRQVEHHKVRLADFLADGDRLRSGDLTTAKFRNGLARAGVNLTASELQSLESSFRSTRRPDQIDWRAFLASVDDSAVPEKPPAGVDQGVLEGALLRIATTVDHRRLNLKPYFQDYDRLHFQHVTQNQFSAVMSTLDIALSGVERLNLFKAFMVYEGKKETNRVNYKAFIKRVDTNEDS